MIICRDYNDEKPCTSHLIVKNTRNISKTEKLSSKEIQKSVESCKLQAVIELPKDEASTSVPPEKDLEEVKSILSIENKLLQNDFSIQPTKL
jgi:hypothetical protein